MEVLRKVYKDGEPVYHVKTDKGLVIRIKGSDDLTDSETEDYYYSFRKMLTK